MSYRIKEKNRLKVRCEQVQAIYACGIVSDILTAGVYTNLSHSQISMLIPVIIFTYIHVTLKWLYSCVGPRASDSEGAVKNEEIQQVLCVIVIISQELPYSSQSLLMYQCSPSVFPDKLNQYLEKIN